MENTFNCPLHISNRLKLWELNDPRRFITEEDTVYVLHWAQPTNINCWDTTLFGQAHDTIM